MKVLIVDDSLQAIAIAKARLEKDGLSITGADSGQAGLESATREKPDLVLLDVDMPDRSGFDVCRALKADPELCMIPVIFLTAMDSTEQKVKGLDLGAVDYVMKPFDAFELQARVRAALRTKRFQDLLIECAHIDPLTELPNRRSLMERLQREWARVQRHDGSLSFIMADLDRFKQVNDTHGHSIGDRLLQEVAKAIISQCRQVDLPARYGGEEFGIVVPDEVATGAARLAERCRRSIEDIRLRVRSKVIQTTASFGVADAQNVRSADALVKQADKALYKAKNAGRNAVKCAGASPKIPQGSARS